MIVCSCTCLTDRELRDAAKALVQAGKKPSFSALYKHLHIRARCGNCRPLIQHLIQCDVVESRT